MFRFFVVAILKQSCKRVIYMKLLLVLLFCVASQAYARPVIVIKETVAEGPNLRVFFSVTGWSISDVGGTICSYESGACIVNEIVWYNHHAAFSHGSWWRFDPPKPPFGLSMGQVLSRLNSQGVYIPYDTSIVAQGGYDPAGICITLEIVSSDTGESADLGDCAPIKLPSVKCDITGSTTIDHKILSDNALNGAQAFTRLNLKCLGSASVIVNASRTNSWGVRLRSDESLYSEIKINNQDATSGITVPVTNNASTPLTITSTLKTRGSVAPGPFNGSTVITVAPN